MKVGVIGNCQAIALGHTLRWLCPDLEVEDCNWGLLGSTQAADALARRLEGCDLVVSQFTTQAAYGELRTSSLRNRVKRLALYPKVAFTGFHPDLIRLGELASPLRDRHSSLIAAAFLLGLPAEHTQQLFNAYVYRIAGFFDEYAKAETYLLRSATPTDVALDESLAEWKSGGVFVTVPNHPRNWVMLSIARSLAHRLEIETQDREGLPSDVFERSAVWPVYPELARQIGVEGSLRFKPPGPDARPIELDEMVERSYAAYARADPDALRAARVSELTEILRREGL